MPTRLADNGDHGGDGEGPRPRSGAAAPPACRGRGLFRLRRSPLARKIVLFNLLGLAVLAAGLLWLNPFRTGLVEQRGAALMVQAELIADVLSGPAVDLPEAGAGVLAQLRLHEGVELRLFDADGALLAMRTGNVPPPQDPAAMRRTPMMDALGALWQRVSGLRAAPDVARGPGVGPSPDAQRLEFALAGRAQLSRSRTPEGATVYTVVAPVRDPALAEAPVIGAVALASPVGEIDQLVRSEREQVLQVVLLALLVSIGLSLVLASTIATPISDLAAAAERGRERSARQVGPGRVRIPDLASRPDEIGRLSAAMRGMVAALYDRIELNEQFAADVAHEIKNPLASLRSAVGTLRVARREDQRDRLLEVIEHDVRRLDRLVSDISNASRLDSELVREREAQFDLVPMLRNLADHLGHDARARGVDFVTDLPQGPILLSGLEERLAQVVVNLVVNAISFCEEGDAVRLWARRRDDRVLVVVEDTGPGIPDSALTKIFKRFYSERPAQQFGNHSGLGLAISRQIVEAHGGVIWAENIVPTEADPGSAPLGARFVVGLPV
ncbi:MAG: sensor N-terminal transmembrane domain-containing protein [Alkalilacustris sp.]